jgi:Flp pilus assembly protein TadD
LERANQALALEDDSVRALYTKAAAYARLDRYASARAALRQASRLKPHDHLPWALLGDIAARHGDFAAARRNYRRAHRLNPRDPQFRQLAEDPRRAIAAPQ